jgi:hypothetical protein
LPRANSWLQRNSSITILGIKIKLIRELLTKYVVKNDLRMCTRYNQYCTDLRMCTRYNQYCTDLRISTRYNQ